MARERHSLFPSTYNTTIEIGYKNLGKSTKRRSKGFVYYKSLYKGIFSKLKRIHFLRSELSLY